MANSGMFTKRMMGLDNRVWMTMLIFILLSAALVGYNYRNDAARKPCEDLNIFINGLSDTDKVFFNEGDELRFRSYFSATDKVVWEFGDNTGKVEGTSPIHVYLKDGIYRILVTLNGQCQYEKKIIVKPFMPARRDTLGNIIEQIIGSDRGFVGEKMTFTTLITGSNYLWYVENDGSYPRQQGDTVNYTFKAPTSYTLVLIVDNNADKKIRKTITVSRSVSQEDGLIKPKVLIEEELKKINPKTPDAEVQPEAEQPKAEVAPPPAKKYKYAADEILKTYLQSLVCGEMNEKDFEEYLCQGSNTAVIENNKERKNFASFCKEVKGKKIEIISVKATRDGENCVVNLAVRLERRWGLRRPCRN
jgi:PKD repeat protein